MNKLYIDKTVNKKQVLFYQLVVLYSRILHIKCCWKRNKSSRRNVRNLTLLGKIKKWSSPVENNNRHSVGTIHTLNIEIKSQTCKNPYQCFFLKPHHGLLYFPVHIHIMQTNQGNQMLNKLYIPDLHELKNCSINPINSKIVVYYTI